MSIDTFYVYEHWRPDKGECFYVGKGKKHRKTVGEKVFKYEEA